MKYIRTIFLVILTFTSCLSGSNKKNKGQRELLPNPEKYEHDGYSKIPDSLKPKFIPDIRVGKISLINSLNIDEYLGENVMDRLVEPSNSYSVFSNDKKQRLTVYYHPGRGKNEFSEFKVDYANNISRNEIFTIDNEFITENNIKLGISIGDLRAIKGEPDSISKNETLQFYYQIKDLKKSNLLKEYNYTNYYANYEFNNGYLIEFSFGYVP